MKEGQLRKLIALVMILTTVLSGCQSMESNDLGMDYSSKIVTGGDYSMFLKPDGNLWGWGDNDYYELGDGTTNTHTEPIMIMADIVDVKTSNGHTMVLKTDGSLWGWAPGYEGSGYAGGTLTPSHIMDDVSVFSIDQYSFHSMVIKTDGSLWAWGNNSWGRLGNGASHHVLQPEKIMSDVAKIAIDSYNTFAIQADGSLW